LGSCGTTDRPLIKRGDRVNRITSQPPENSWTAVEEVALLSALVLCPLLYSFHQSSFLVPKETYAAVAVAAALAARYAAGPLRPVFGAGLFGMALAAYAAVSAASVAWSVSWYWTVRSTGAAVLATVFFALAAERCRSPRFVARGLAAIIITGVAVAALSVLQLAGPGRLLFPRFPGNPQTMYSTFGNDSIVAGYLVVSAPLLAGYLLVENRRGRIVAAMCAVLLVIYALLALLTRGAWIAVTVAGLCVLGTLIRTGRRALAKKAVRLMVIGVCGAVLFGVVQSVVPGTATGGTTFVERLRSSFDLSQPGIADRWKVFLAAAYIVRDHPVAGAGAGTFGFLAPRYQGEVFSAHGRPADLLPSQEEPFYVHNEYMQPVAEMGVAGLAVMLAMVIAGTREVTRLWRKGVRTRQNDVLLCGGTGALLAVAVFGTTHFPFHVVSHTLAFLFTMAAFHGYYHCEECVQQQVAEESQTRSNRSGLGRRAAVVCLIPLVVSVPAIWHLVADRLYWDGYLMEKQQPGASPEAVHRLELAARLDPYNGRILTAYGWALANRYRWTEALGCFERAQSSWDTAVLHDNLGIVNEKLGRQEAAERHYRMAVYRDPAMTETEDRPADIEPHGKPGIVRGHALIR